MFVKKFEAQTLDKALSLVRAELGPDALVLSTSQKPLGLLRKPGYEVTVAVENRSGQVTKETETQSTQASQWAEEQGEAPSEVKAQSLRKTARERYEDFADPPSRNFDLFKYVERPFREAGIEPRLAKDLTRQLVFDYPKEELLDPVMLRHKQIELLATSCHTLSYPLLVSRSRWVALGNPGAGKTSTLVKLAILLKRRGQKPALCSLDTRKLLGRREMASYAEVLQVPFRELREPSEKDVIHLYEAPAFPLKGKQASVLEKLCQENGAFIVLDATTRFREMCRVINECERFQPRAVSFTRFDVASQLGVVFDVLRMTKLPLLGASISSSFQNEFQFYGPEQLAETILGRRKGRT